MGVAVAVLCVMVAMGSRAKDIPSRGQLRGAAADDSEFARAGLGQRSAQAAEPSTAANEPGGSEDGDIGRYWAWYSHHPLVLAVVVGSVEEVMTEVVDGFVMSQCTLRTLETIRGESRAEWQMLTWGGERDGQRSWASHLPQCKSGEIVVVALGEAGGHIIPFGGDTYYGVIRDEAGRPRRMGELALQFVDALR